MVPTKYSPLSVDVLTEGYWHSCARESPHGAADNARGPRSRDYSRGDSNTARVRIEVWPSLILTVVKKELVLWPRMVATTADDLLSNRPCAGCEPLLKTTLYSSPETDRTGLLCGLALTAGQQIWQ